MNVSTRSEHGLRALIHLADADGRSAAPAREIAERWNAPVKYLPMGCASSYDYEPCDFELSCGLKTLWARARAALVSVLDQTTIADLCTPANRANLVSLKFSRK
jgi:DNA-binding IscR family transcriptional regulator